MLISVIMNVRIFGGPSVYVDLLALNEKKKKKADSVTFVFMNVRSASLTPTTRRNSK